MLCTRAGLVQSTKMILKFRETHIGNMEKGRRGRGEAGVTEGGEGQRARNGVVSEDGLASTVSGLHTYVHTQLEDHTFFSIIICFHTYKV